MFSLQLFFKENLFSDAPTCKPDQTRIYGVAKQERTEIVCQVDANPPEVTKLKPASKQSEKVVCFFNLLYG